MEHIVRESLSYAVYFAPRGKIRLLNIGSLLAQRYLSRLDKLIGFIGDAGAGKSLLIKGMFPGLELTNDDDGINLRPLPLIKSLETGRFNSHTYHMDVRFEMAFTQMHLLVEAVTKAIEAGKRVIVEHFDLLYPHLGMNAELIVGIGEEVIATRPSIFGPLPVDIADIVFKSIKYRQMTHSAEDLTEHVLETKYDVICYDKLHTDVRHGFVIEFEEKPDVNLDEVEESVNELISKGIDICCLDEEHISIGEDFRHYCTGPRIHIGNTSDIKNFRLCKEFKYDRITKLYALIGLVGTEHTIDLNDINKLIL